MSDKDTQLRNVFLTCWIKDISQEDLLKKMQLLPLKNICIGAIEKTESELGHFHVVCTFTCGVRFSTIKNLCSTIHIERVKTKSSLLYSMKEGCFYNDFELELNDSNDLYIDLVNDMTILNWCDIVKKYPKLVMSHYNNLLAMYNDLNK